MRKVKKLPDIQEGEIALLGRIINPDFSDWSNCAICRKNGKIYLLGCGARWGLDAYDKEWPDMDEVEIQVIGTLALNIG